MLNTRIFSSECLFETHNGKLIVEIAKKNQKMEYETFDLN